MVRDVIIIITIIAVGIDIIYKIMYQPWIGMFTFDLGPL